MRPIFNLMLQICLLRSGPQELPCSRSLVRFFCGLYLAVGFLSSSVTMPAPIAFAMSLLDIALLALFVAVLLSIYGYRSRFYQTFLAQLGVGTLLMFISVPLLLWQSLAGINSGVSTLITLLMFWNLAAMGHIFRHALAVSIFVGALLAVAYLCLTLLVFGFIASTLPSLSTL